MKIVNFTRMFANSSKKLRRHQSRSRCDPSKKVFWCSNCNKRFSTEKAKNIHEKTHFVGKLYKCDPCGIEFTYRWSMKKHKCKASDISRKMN